MGDTMVDQQTADGAHVAAETIDFKMVTFSLGGKDYGIDIMEVKEIAKFLQFTYVPNTAPYVRGVYNLRGEIISVIDLRLFFNLPTAASGGDGRENGLILRLESSLIGVIVDSIERVVGLSSRQVQPPHPIFGDINVKYIKGVAENEGRLYIILDVNRIFSRDAESVARPTPAALVPEAGVSDQLTAATPVPAAPVAPIADETAQFVREALATFIGFTVSELNDDWFRTRLESWRRDCQEAGRDVQLASETDARTFVASFFSRHTDQLWSDEFSTQLGARLPARIGPVYQVWNPGCGSGRETYSLAVLLRTKLTDGQIKIWAGDKDLLAVSNAPNLVVSREELPDSHRPFVTESQGGEVYNAELKEMILFEFSDVLHAAGLPRMDIVLCRDLLSFFTDEERRRFMGTLEETVRPGGVLIVGDNERLHGDAWAVVSGGGATVYQRR